MSTPAHAFSVHAGAPPSDDRSAETLLPNLERDALVLLEFAVRRAGCENLRRVDWRQLATDVYPAQWRELTRKNAKFLASFTADGLPWGRSAYADAGKALSPGGETDLRIAYAVHVLSAAVAVALIDAGFTADNVPGHPMAFRKSGVSMEPFTAVAQRAGSMSLED